ncbi:MAG: NUDIX hydrolase [Roseomonas sp.]|nr:NUDIX hydrolase [Roseomonas sp.]MCA3328712.1 NUDIX hydrolase [Roseomonas sp.]MCA3331936.1 NUDIX hydrolase [Roseomonas sp.]MCA3334584.1 NUDIX hydrolase [Roseomonas sp.]MCA3345371.1 NUDIX hydrolase [Roseomonas sp.]
MSNAPREYPDRPWVGIGCIVFREEAVLLVRRGKPPRIGQWSLPGGAQHVGEKAEEAARRELREETSIEVGQMALAYVFDAINQDDDGRARYHYTIIDFAALWLEGEARAGDDVSEVAWALPHELHAYDLTEAAHEAIAAARIALGLG